MGRKAKFSKTDFINTALDLLAEHGLSGVNMASIAQKTSAPVGSVYHRFSSRELLLAELWVELIQSFQSEFIEKLKKGDLKKASLHTLEWVRANPNKAKVFLLHRREDLIKGDWPEALKERVEGLISRLNEALCEFTRKELGKATKKNLARITFCLIHVPTSAVRGILESGEPVPGYYDQFVSETVEALIISHRS